MVDQIGRHRWKILAIVGLACIPVANAFHLVILKIPVDHLLAEVGALLLVVGILHWFFELGLRKETIREVVATISGNTRLHDAGLVSCLINSREVNDTDEWRNAANLVVGVQYSPKFFKDFHRIIQERSAAGRPTKAILLTPGGAAETYLRATGTGSPRVRNCVEDIKQLLEDADAEASSPKTSVVQHDRVLRYSFIQTDDFIWVKLFANSPDRAEVPAFKVRAGTPLYRFFSQDTERLIRAAHE